MVILRRLVGLNAIALALAIAPPALILPTPVQAERPYPTPTNGGRERIPRTGTCPVGYIGKGQFCEALHQDTPRAYPHVPGTTCPAGTFRSGDACVSFR